MDPLTCWSLLIGEEMHKGSNWTARRGDEWGAGFTFSRAGCWEIVALRGTLVGRVGIPVQ
jgi:hypothetical protein